MLPFIPLLLFAVAVAGSSFQSGNTGSSGNRIIVDDSKTVIAFPTSEHWWCIGAINVVQWWWAPEASPQLQVVLANRNIDLLPWGTLLKDKGELRYAARLTKVEAKILSTYTEDLDS